MAEPRPPLSHTLGIFAKQPRPGQVKTRLAEACSPESAATVAEAFLLDTLNRLQRVAARKVVAFDPPDAAGYFSSIIPDGYELVPQASGDLGQRLEAFFRQAFAAGWQAVVVVGSDSPTLPLDYVATAFSELRSKDVVLGPATDGGYYLVGCAGEYRSVFDGIRWSSPAVLEQTLRRIQNQGLSLALLPPWYDVDDETGWTLLKSHIWAMRLAGQDPLVPRTEALLASENPGKRAR